MEGGQVGELPPEEEEEGVEVVNVLGEEVPPGHVQRVQPVIGVWQVYVVKVRYLLI